MLAVCRPTCGVPSAEFEPRVIALRVMRRPGAAEPDATALPVPPEGLTIGRADDCALVLPDPLRLVSRRHAQVIAIGEAVRLRCISSSAPFWVNGMQLDPGGERALMVGDRLRIGGFELAVEPAGQRLRRARAWIAGSIWKERPIRSLPNRRCRPLTFARSGGDQRGCVLADESACDAHRHTAGAD